MSEGSHGDPGSFGVDEFEFAGATGLLWPSLTAALGVIFEIRIEPRRPRIVGSYADIPTR
jgi:hypothetical protein